jgi:hypothetical protein
MSNTVISICSLSHSDVWKITSKLLPEMLDADNYWVFVPANEFHEFKKITDKRIEVKIQEDLGGVYENLLREATSAAGNEKRYGWYLQQFHKIAALQLATTDIVTIWDADCVPVSPIEITNLDKKLVYINSSKEFHQPYFENIERLLQLKRVQNFSFVIPSFPMRKEWVSSFITDVENLHRTNWYQAIISLTDFSLQSGFSETETLGTWVANNHFDGFTSRIGTWERYGQSRFGYARNIKPLELLALGKENNLEIITFENWDLRGIKRLVQKLKKYKKYFQ